jgi:hypothetical protein
LPFESETSKSIEFADSAIFRLKSVGSLFVLLCCKGGAEGFPLIPLSDVVSSTTILFYVLNFPEAKGGRPL